MHITVKNLLDIKNNIRVHLDDSGIKSNPKIIAVSKTFNRIKFYLLLIMDILILVRIKFKKL